MSTEERFNAAVKVIGNLPKSGSLKPSDDLKLKFYGFFKQATEGSNSTKKPGFLDPVGKYKWDAWTNLANMSKEDAMKGYVDTFIEVCKTLVLADCDVGIFEYMVAFKEHLPEGSQQIMTKHNF